MWLVHRWPAQNQQNGKAPPPSQVQKETTKAKTSTTYFHLHLCTYYSINPKKYLMFIGQLTSFTVEVHSDFHCCATESLELGGLSICDQFAKGKWVQFTPCNVIVDMNTHKFMCVCGFICVWTGKYTVSTSSLYLSDSNVSNFFPHLAALVVATLIPKSDCFTSFWRNLSPLPNGCMKMHGFCSCT